MPEAFVFPTSFAQQRLWFLDQLMPGSSFYNLHAAVPISAPVDEDALRRALQEIVTRHETLRTRFVAIDGEPKQVVAPELELALPVEDLQHLPPSAREAEALRLATEESRRPFDLTTAPLVRTRLLTLEPSRHVLLITLHHIIADGWSMGVFFQELRQLYVAFARGMPSPLPELPIQYADFACWQRDWLQGEVLEQQLAYWRERLADLPALILPTDHKRPAIASFRGASYQFELPAELLAAVQGLARAHRCTPFMVLLAVFKVLLSRYTGQDDIVVGGPIANRNRAEVEPLIGFFVNTLVLRTDLAGDPPFPEVLGRVREVTLGAYAHQDLPFERLVEELQPERDLSRNPLVQVTFQLHNAPPVTDLAAGGSGRVERFDVQRATSNFDITFDLWEFDGILHGRFDYSTDLFEPATIRRMAEHYRALLASVLENPEAPISRLALLTPEERRLVLGEWSGAALPYPREARIPDLVSEQAARAPAAVAVDAADGRLSYAELEASANRVARWLHDRGVGPESLVGIAIERSTHLIVGLLGILKAGGAYVALDPSYPRPRLEMMLADGSVATVLTDRGSVELFRELGREVLALDGGLAELGGYDTAPPRSAATAESLAYVAYTSGSTGRPKGVCVPHRAVVRLVRGNHYAELSDREAVLHFSPVSFDASTFEIWGCLANGGRLVVAPPGPLSLEELGQTLTRNRVTTAWLTAGLFHQMVDAQLPALLGLRQLLGGGDVLSAPHLRRLLEAPGRRRVINGYGPTENTTFTCCHVMESSAQVDQPVPIGRPIANTRVHVLDRHGNPVPAGIPGELYAGGDGLARGYLNAPEATAERFVPDPFQPGQRLYRTGDRVRFRPDGVIEFLGRFDRQIKVRGFRVEPGEVEAVLARHEAVASAVVAPAADESGGLQLVAYVVPRAGRVPTPEELRRHLARELPPHLVPSAFAAVEHIPLTPNGKVDTERLVRLDLPRDDGAEPFAAANSEVEEALAAIWGQVLRRDTIGVHDDFFADLGGHSLLATQVISRVREAFGVEIPLRRLFEGPTIAALAAAVEEAILDELEAEDEADAEADELDAFASIDGGMAGASRPGEGYHGA